MKLEEIVEIRDQAVKEFNTLDPRLYVGDKKIGLDPGLAICYYRAVVRQLIKKGNLPSDFKDDIELIEKDSETNEDDYL